MDYKNTVFLPQTTFSMKGELPKKEPLILQKWKDDGLYNQILEKNKDGPTFVLHDGPPYANGPIHTGHALNKILKDTLIKYHNLLGYHSPYIPGWDCHGLPIEWMVETHFRKEGKDKDVIAPTIFRGACRAFAEKWVGIQSEQFQRLGILADWDHPYLTMAPESEAIISREILRFLMNGTLYQGVKPVMWSVIEKTALAEAEVEYKDKVSSSLYVEFPLAKTSHPNLRGAHILIWTTTPWSLPGNRAIAYKDDAVYVVLARPGKAPLVVAESLSPAIMALTDEPLTIQSRIDGAELEGAFAHHPWHKLGYDFPVPLVAGGHVSLEQGTGLVHTAPGHGVEDFQMARLYDLEVAQPVNDSGFYHDHIPLWGGKHVFKVSDDIICSLDEVGLLFHKTTLTHSYPHSWRSKAPLIYRTTPQWFISLESGLREKALEAISHVDWVPERGRTRISSMVAGRPDWCLSRQRSWGVPLPFFINKKTGEPLKDEALNARILSLIATKGCDVWFEEGITERLLNPDYDPNDYDICRDIADVWFESGCTYLFVAGEGKPITLPIDLYLEGSDQHRGWFQSSLLEGVGSYGKAPYKRVMTHGFLLDQGGYKMSKSAGNTLAPDDILPVYGADIMRLWVVSSDYFEDLKLGKDILKHQEDAYRRLRNTLRYLLGNLRDVPFTNTPTALPALERWVLHRLVELDAEIKRCLDALDMHALFRTLYQFCSSDLSAFYFDVRKDALYCESRDSSLAQATLFTLQKLFDVLAVWLSPILSFTAEEAWQTLYPGTSVHLQGWPFVDDKWNDPALGRQVEALRAIRRDVTGALEKARMERLIGSSLEGAVDLYGDAADPALWEGFDAAAFFITSHVRLMPDRKDGTPLTIRVADGAKCERCWRVLEEVGTQPSHSSVCVRCAESVRAL